MAGLLSNMTSRVVIRLSEKDVMGEYESWIGLTQCESYALTYLAKHPEETGRNPQPWWRLESRRGGGLVGLVEVRDREKVMHRIKRMDTPILKGHQIYHNFVRPHEGLNGNTPSERVGIKVEGKNKWLTIIQNASKRGRMGEADVSLI